MKTTKKQLANFAIGLIKEILKQNSSAQVQYRKGATIAWIYDGDTLKEGIYLYDYHSLKENKDKFKQAILKIRGIIK
jgi:hypothetical protein